MCEARCQYSHHKCGKWRLEDQAKHHKQPQPAHQIWAGVSKDQNDHSNHADKLKQLTTDPSGFHPSTLQCSSSRGSARWQPSSQASWGPSRCNLITCNQIRRRQGTTNTWSCIGCRHVPMPSFSCLIEHLFISQIATMQMNTRTCRHLMMAANLKHLRIGLTNWEQKGNDQFTQENIGNMGDWKHCYQINCAWKNWTVSFLCTRVIHIFMKFRMSSSSIYWMEFVSVKPNQYRKSAHWDIVDFATKSAYCPQSFSGGGLYF